MTQPSTREVSQVKQQHLHMQLNVLRAMASIQSFRGMWVEEEGEGETNNLHQERT